uniref:Transposase-associated domain-containing protein n=1 Tax=Brassica oleracea var. oleracea TaxID=109376 RepID=A0A0D3BKZ0_BRAOL
MGLVQRQPEAETGMLRCLCSNCKNRKVIKEWDVWTHLYLSGFTRSYKIWYHHGETDYEYGSTSEPQPAADQNDGEPVDDFVLMKTAHTNKHTGEIDDGVDKDDRIAALEQKMADQEAGWEATRRQNEQMMEMMRMMYPNEQFP